MNPCTLGWYLPLLVKDIPGALQPSDSERHPPAGSGGGGAAGRAHGQQQLSRARGESVLPSVRRPRR